MQRFARLIEKLNNTTRTNDKRDALVEYLREAPDEDKVWLIAIFTGRRPKRLVNTTFLKNWCMEVTGLPQWLFEESYHTVGDPAEAISLMLPAPQKEEELALYEVMLEIRKLQKARDEEKKDFVLKHWTSLSKPACFVFNKIIIGGFRIGVSRNIVVQAVAMYS